MLGRGGSTSRMIRRTSAWAILRERRPVERLCPGEQLVQQHAQRVDVRAGVDVGAAFGLLGAHRFVRANGLPDERVERAVGQAVARQRLGDAEIDHLHLRLAVGGVRQHVAGLDIAVDQRLGVGVGDGVAHLREQLQPLADGQPVVVGVPGDLHAGHVFHHKKGTAQLVGAGVEHFRDIRMIHPGQGLPLGFETGDHFLGVEARLDEL